ncbi:MAG TPA: SCO family protein [Anaerolineales bacterium]|nr:SCO family protein [Anaerolineales bacterium]
MDRKLAWVGLASLALIALAIVATLMLGKPPQFRGTTYDPLVPAPEIALKKANGEEYRLTDQKGKVVLLYFGYTYCPDICPTTLATLKQAYTNLGSDANKVEIVFITVDPDRDTPQSMQRYVNQFDASFIGLSGSTADLQPVWTEYGIFRELGPKDASGNYIVSHTARILVVDKQGNLHLSYPYGEQWQDILFDLRLLINQGGSQG